MSFSILTILPSCYFSNFQKSCLMIRRLLQIRIHLEKNSVKRYNGILSGMRKIMKTGASIKADPSKGDKIVRRQGRVYVINKKDPNRKQRQKGPARKK